MMSEIIRFQLKGIKMIKLKGLNKILRTGLLAGALLGVTTPLMAKPLFTDTDLIDYLSKSKSNIKKEYAIDCNSQIDGSKYLNSGWNLSKNLPQEWKTAFLSCVNKKQLSKKEQELQKIVDERNEQIKKDEEWLVACRNYVRESRKKAESNFLKKNRCSKSEDGKISCYSNAFYSAYGDTKPKWWTYSGSHFEEKFENEQNQADNECLSKAASLAIMHPKLEIKKAVRQP